MTSIAKNGKIYQCPPIVIDSEKAVSDFCNSNNILFYCAENEHEYAPIAGWVDIDKERNEGNNILVITDRKIFGAIKVYFINEVNNEN